MGAISASYLGAVPRILGGRGERLQKVGRAKASVIEGVVGGEGGIEP